MAIQHDMHVHVHVVHAYIVCTYTGVYHYHTHPQKHHFSDFLRSKDIYYGWYVGKWWTHTCTSLQLYASSVLFV